MAMAASASVSVAAAASPMQIYDDASLDAPNQPQIHFQILTLTLTLTLDAPLDARCGYALTCSLMVLVLFLSNQAFFTADRGNWNNLQAKAEIF